MPDTGPKRTKFEIGRDRALVAQLYLQGKTQQEIGDRLGFTQQQISYDIKAIQAEWKKSTSLDLDLEKGRALDKLDMLERVYFDAWEASKGERTEEGSRLVELPARVARVGTDKEGNPLSVTVPAGRRSESYYKKSKMLGDAAYLDGMLRCAQERAKLLGLYASQKKGVTIDLVLAALPSDLGEAVRRQLAEALSEEPD